MRPYLIEQRQLLLGVEALDLQGYPVELVFQSSRKTGIDQTLCEDLAGNAFSSVMHMSLVLCVLACLPPLRPPDNTESIGDDELLAVVGV